ncbi:hypothetical protein CRUP_013850 [Coryphaenoides rupestris]|nr:hypothetical protein CRUP_013850 [Coryphaenoides rupestris]
MAQRFHRMEFNPIYSEAAALDPRFKKQAFGDARAAVEALQRIAGAAGRVTLQAEAAEQQEAGAAAGHTPQESSAIWSLFEERVSGGMTRRNATADAIMEVRSYLEEPLLQRTADPLEWWKSRAMYPRLVKVMMTRLCITATSVPSERIFSKPGQIITERRNRLSPAKVRQLVFLNTNLPLNLT